MAEYLGEPARRLRWGTVLTLLLLLLAGWWMFAEVLDESRDEALQTTATGPTAAGRPQVLTRGEADAGMPAAGQGDDILHEEDTVGELIAGNDGGETGAATGDGEPEERELAETGADRSAATSTATSGATLARALAQPQGHFGRSVSGTAVVTRVDSDRGFWVSSGKSETYAVLAERLDQPEGRTRILAGQELRLTGTVHPSSQASTVPELKDAQTGSLLGRAPAFLRVTAVQILEEAAER